MDPGDLLSAGASVSLSALCVSGTWNSVGIFILLTRLRCDSLNQNKGPVLPDLIQNAAAISRSYQSNTTAKKQDRVQSVLRDSRWSKEWWKHVNSTRRKQRGLSTQCIVQVQVYSASAQQNLSQGGAGLTEMQQVAVGFIYQSKLMRLCSIRQGSICLCGHKYFIWLHCGEGPRRRAEKE